MTATEDANFSVFWTDFGNVWIEGETMNTSLQIPASVKAAIQRQPADSPQFLLPEDREDFLTGVEPEHQVEAEQTWEDCVRTNEDQERRFRVEEKRSNQIRRTPYFLSVEQIAIRWNVSARTVWRMIRDGRLPSVQIGTLRRINETDVEKLETASSAVA